MADSSNRVSQVRFLPRAPASSPRMPAGRQRRRSRAETPKQPGSEGHAHHHDSGADEGRGDESLPIRRTLQQGRHPAQRRVSRSWSGVRGPATDPSGRPTRVRSAATFRPRWEHGDVTPTGLYRLICAHCGHHFTRDPKFLVRPATAETQSEPDARASRKDRLRDWWHGLRTRAHPTRGR